MVEVKERDFRMRTKIMNISSGFFSFFQEIKVRNGSIHACFTTHNQPHYEAIPDPCIQTGANSILY